MSNIVLLSFAQIYSRITFVVIVAGALLGLLSPAWGALQTGTSIDEDIHIYQAPWCEFSLYSFVSMPINPPKNKWFAHAFLGRWFRVLMGHFWTVLAMQNKGNSLKTRGSLVRMLVSGTSGGTGEGKTSVGKNSCGSNSVPNFGTVFFRPFLGLGENLSSHFKDCWILHTQILQL